MEEEQITVWSANSLLYISHSIWNRKRYRPYSVVYIALDSQRHLETQPLMTTLYPECLPILYSFQMVRLCEYNYLSGYYSSFINISDTYIVFYWCKIIFTYKEVLGIMHMGTELRACCVSVTGGPWLWEGLSDDDSPPWSYFTFYSERQGHSLFLLIKRNSG